MRGIQRRMVLLVLVVLALMVGAWTVTADDVGGAVGGADDVLPVTDVCPVQGLQPRPADFAAEGLIVTTFDRRNLWVYNVKRRARYPLENTRPCGANCRASPEGGWLTYIDPTSGFFSKMRFDGSERTTLVKNAADLIWWAENRLLAWSSGRRATLLDSGGGFQDAILSPQGTVSIQPVIGRWALTTQYDGIAFSKVLVDLADAEASLVVLGAERMYFNQAAWSPDGAWLAYAEPSDDDQSVTLYALQPDQDTVPQAVARFEAARLGGQTHGFSWSPDGAQLAFWVVTLNGDNPETDTEHAIIHSFSPRTGELRRYCGLVSTEDLTPNPARLVWSPDSAYIALSDNPPDDARGNLLIALNVQTGVYIELSEGLYPALGRADAIAWGLSPY